MLNLLKSHRFAYVLGIAAIMVVSMAGTARLLNSGAYIFAGETNGVDLVLHPQGYTGFGGQLDVEICLDPGTTIPMGATSLNDVVNSISNNAAIWNQLQPIVGNSLLGAANDLAPGQLDFESVALHEVGHCLGLAHVNAASESGLPGNDANYTKATDGVLDGNDNTTAAFNLNPGADGIRGTSDDIRGDDTNLHWFRMDTNDPGQLPLPAVIDNTTYDRDQSSLPAGHTFAANLDRTAASVLGHPSTSPINTEAVMQQGTFSDEDQRRLTADGVASILFGMSGVDETAGTADDYTINVINGGVSSSASCDVTFQFQPSASVGLAFCQVGGAFIGTNHARITTAIMRFGHDFNWYFNQGPACRQTIDLTTGLWKQIALSCEPLLGSDTVADVFGDDLTGVYDVNWVVYERDALNDTYVKLGLADPLQVGRGYWIKSNQANQTVNIEGNFNADGDIPLDEDANGRSNMVGHRYWYDLAWADVLVDDGGVIKTLAQVDPGGACQGPNPVANGCIMSRIAHKWNGAAYEAFDGQTPGAEGTLENFDGLFVKAFTSGIELRIPDQRSLPSAPHSEQVVGAPLAEQFAAARTPQIEVQGALGAGLRVAAENAETGGTQAIGPWYARLTVQSGSLKDSGNVIGQLATASKRYDQHDLPELDPFGSEYLSIIFPHDNWKERSGIYTTDFHRYNPNKGDHWDFQVRSHAAGLSATVSWDGPASVLYRTFLVDVESGKRIRVRPGGSYTFTTASTHHNFRWYMLKPR